MFLVGSQQASWGRERENFKNYGGIGLKGGGRRKVQGEAAPRDAMRIYDVTLTTHNRINMLTTRR